MLKMSSNPREERRESLRLGRSETENDGRRGLVCCDMLAGWLDFFRSL